MSVKEKEDVKIVVLEESSSYLQEKEDIMVRLGKPSDKEDKDLSSEYLFSKYSEMTLEEATEILQQAILYHDDDINFSIQTMDDLKLLIKDSESSDVFSKKKHEENVKINAVLIAYHSPYPEIRAVTTPYDDPTENCATFRAYFLGFLWTIIGTGLNQFFNTRQPSIDLSSGILQILLLPCGRAMEYLPDWGITIKGKRHSLNPGPWTFKEQMLTSIILNVSNGGAFIATFNIMTQKLPIFYGNQWAGLGYQFLLVLSTQFASYGFSGLMRKISIYPVRSLWPIILPTIALNKALVEKEHKTNINGWTISRYRLFLYIFLGAFIYFWIPNYFFQSTSMFNWTTWISPNNFNLAAITGTISGIGLNPMPTLDWTLINFWFPLQIPFLSQVNGYAGALVAGLVVIPAIYYTNSRWTSYLPINTNTLFTNTGQPYDVKNILTNGLFDAKKYEKYSPPFYTAGNLVVYGGFFVLYPFAIIYTLASEWKSLLKAFGSFWETLRHPGVSNYAQHKDNHSQMMSKFREVPDWWYFLILTCAIGCGISCVKIYPTNTPVWSIFLAMGLNFLFLIPITIIYSTNGVQFGLNVLMELIFGSIFPGNGYALMLLKAYGYNVDGQAQNYITDLKMGHYAKIPPRAMFFGQLASTLLQVLVTVGVLNWQMGNVKDICTIHQAEKFTCPSANSFFSSSVVWGVLGPKRVFKTLYPALKWMFVLGAVLPFIVLGLKRWFPRSMYYVQPIPIIGGFTAFAPFNLAYVTPGIYVSWFFMSYLKTRYVKWWERYNYIIASSLQAGVAAGAVIIFFSVQYNSKPLNWWGNAVAFAGADAQGGARLAVPINPGYFGPPKGQYP